MSLHDVERRILVTGATGQIGCELTRTLQGLGRVIPVDRAALDLSDFDQIRAVVRKTRPALIVNSAAYTAVDQAESEPLLAMRINGEAPAVFAEEAKKLGAALVHYSTDYVFDGEQRQPYREDDMVNPQNAYGRAKLAGEMAIAATGANHLLLRTSWIYGARGKNFLQTMLRLAHERADLEVVTDQFGAPTWSNTVATLTARILSQALAATDSDLWWAAHSGVYHLTASDSTSWHGFATAIFELAGLPSRPNVMPILTSKYPALAKRPMNSRLSNRKLVDVFGLVSTHWREALQLCLRGADFSQQVAAIDRRSGCTRYSKTSTFRPDFARERCG